MQNQVSKSFVWRDSRGTFRPVTEMETSHLFFTVRMIWNNCLPSEFHLLPFRIYTFKGQYSIEYLANAIRAMIPELTKRNDLEDRFLNDLRIMESYFSSEKLDEQMIKLERENGS